jgi:hypothetical protein
LSAQMPDKHEGDRKSRPSRNFYGFDSEMADKVRRTLEQWTNVIRIASETKLACVGDEA